MFKLKIYKYETSKNRKTEKQQNQKLKIKETYKNREMNKFKIKMKYIDYIF